MPKHRVLIVEDEDLMRSILRRLMTDAGYDVFTADSSESALTIIRQNDIAITITDIKMAGMSGLDLLDRINTFDQRSIVVIMTAYSSVDSAVAALRRGAYDYIIKPFVNEDLLQTVHNAIRQRDLFRENRALRRELYQRSAAIEIIGDDPELKRLLGLVKKVGPTEASVVVEGESGTGKELIAKSIHVNSGRAGKPFLAVNCGALSESLLESELFGHVKGSFTGAGADKKGLFRSAEGGTIFLDEIGEMPFALQVKLLRALQEREVTPVGLSIAIEFDARIVAATNRSLEDEVAEGRFRKDLFYRLNVVEIAVPPLRQRHGDIPLLARHFAAKNARAQNVGIKTITEQAMSILLSHEWPGNVRELENVVERAFILSGDEIDVDSLPQRLRSAPHAPEGQNRSHPPTLYDIEQKYILETLASCGDDKAAAARLLGIDLSTLYRKLKRYWLP